MAKQNPFKKIAPEVTLPTELKEDILQELKGIIAVTEGDSEESNKRGNSQKS